MQSPKVLSYARVLKSREKKGQKKTFTIFGLKFFMFRIWLKRSNLKM